MGSEEEGGGEVRSTELNREHFMAESPAWFRPGRLSSAT